MQTPKISVITVSFNHGEFIRQTIESVLLQRYPNFEHIVVDGGSTDDTTDILKAYPHLIWTSEPDRGQSHALNKGLRQATGDIIAWINSDDWYPPGVFKDIALALEDYPIVMGACELTDRYGVRDITVPNVERNWFDLLKYWVYFSSPAQPSIFFRRSLLKEIEYAPGVYIDEDLDFCMDLDLWLRIAKRYPLARRVNRLFSYYRMYETNKTGLKTEGAYREMERVFRRYSNQLCQVEHKVSFLVPMTAADDSIEKTLKSLAQQTVIDHEVLLLDYATKDADSRELRKQALRLGDQYRNSGLRYTKAEAASGNLLQALTHGMAVSRAPIVSVIGSGDILGSDYSAQVQQYFSQDSLAILLPFSAKPEWKSRFTRELQGQQVFNTDAIFMSPFILPRFVVRQAAWCDLGGFQPDTNGEISALLAFRQLMSRAAYKGWYLNVQNSLPLSCADDLWEDSHELLEAFRLYINAALVEGIHSEFARDPFASVRAQNGFCLLFPEAIRESARRVLASAPPRWSCLTTHSQEQELRSINSEFPHFSPAWYLLGKNLLKQGKEEEARTAIKNFEAARAAEGNL